MDPHGAHDKTRTKERTKPQYYWRGQTPLHASNCLMTGKTRNKQGRDENIKRIKNFMEITRLYIQGWKDKVSRQKGQR